MKNEISEFFLKIENELEDVVNEARNIITTGRVNDQRAFVFLHIIYENLGEEKSQFFLEKLHEIISEQKLHHLCHFMINDVDGIKNYFLGVKKEKEEEFVKLVDFEWKFIGLSTIDKFEVNEITPKVLLRLIFNNASERIIETDYAGLKKFQEEIEDALNSFNSTYARRIETFAK